MQRLANRQPCIVSISIQSQDDEKTGLDLLPSIEDIVIVKVYRQEWDHIQINKDRE